MITIVDSNTVTRSPGIATKHIQQHRFFRDVHPTDKSYQDEIRGFVNELLYLNSWGNSGGNSGVDLRIRFYKVGCIMRMTRQFVNMLPKDEQIKRGVFRHFCMVLIN